MTPQPLVSCWSAMVAYLLVSPWAFWMSASKPASLRAAAIAGRSPFSQRGDEAVSGRMTQARVEALSPPEPEPDPPEQAARASEATPATTTAAMRDFFMALLRAVVV